MRKTCYIILVLFLIIASIIVYGFARKRIRNKEIIAEVNNSCVNAKNIISISSSIEKTMIICDPGGGVIKFKDGGYLKMAGHSWHDVENTILVNIPYFGRGMISGAFDYVFITDEQNIKLKSDMHICGDIVIMLKGKMEFVDAKEFIAETQGICNWTEVNDGLTKK